MTDKEQLLLNHQEPNRTEQKGNARQTGEILPRSRRTDRSNPHRKQDSKGVQQITTNGKEPRTRMSIRMSNDRWMTSGGSRRSNSMRNGKQGNHRATNKVKEKKSNR